MFVGTCMSSGAIVIEIIYLLSFFASSEDRDLSSSLSRANVKRIEVATLQRLAEVAATVVRSELVIEAVCVLPGPSYRPRALQVIHSRASRLDR